MRLFSFNPPADLKDTYYNLYGDVHLEKFVFNWSICEIIVGTLGLIAFGIFQINTNFALEFAGSVIFGSLLLVGRLKSIWWLYIPEAICQVVNMVSFGVLFVQNIILGFIYSFFNEDTLKSNTDDHRFVYALKCFGAGVGYALLAALSIFLFCALIRACQFKRNEVKIKAAAKNVVEFKKGEGV